MRFILGLVIMAIGIFLMVKTEWMLSNFGRIAFFENKFGTEGGSRLGYKLVGMTFFFIGLLVATNLIGGFLQWIFSPLTRYSM